MPRPSMRWLGRIAGVLGVDSLTLVLQHGRREPTALYNWTLRGENLADGADRGPARWAQRSLEVEGDTVLVRATMTETS